MKISEPETEGQERASSRTVSPRRFGHACLILIALVSRDALAQTYLDVTFQAGESVKTVEAPRAANFIVRVRAPDWICNWPTSETVKNFIRMHANTGVLLQRLTQMENIGTASGTAIVGTLNVLVPYQQISISLSPERDLLKDQSDTTGFRATDAWIARCLTIEESRTAIRDIRIVIRAHLGLAPPTTGGSAPSSIAPTSTTK